MEEPLGILSPIFNKSMGNPLMKPGRKIWVYFLFPFSIVFFLGVLLRNLFFDLGIFGSSRAKKPVICIGNLTTGGTGKTPWVGLICEYLKQQNQKPAIVSRGYSGKFSGIMEVQKDSDPRLCGEEPLWLKQKTCAPVYVGRNRFATIQRVVLEQKVDVILLDDGYQHRSLKRDFDIVLFDASAPQNHYSLLPMGRMRESFSSLKRAGAVIINKCNWAEPEAVERIMQWCRPFISSSKIFLSDYEFKEWKPLFGELSCEFKKEKLSLACGLGNPQTFLKTVKSLGLDPIGKFIFPDHYFWKPDDLKKITDDMKKTGSLDLLITAKDAIKLSLYREHFVQRRVQLWVCSMETKPRQSCGALFSQILKVVQTGSHLV